MRSCKNWAILADANDSVNEKNIYKSRYIKYGRDSVKEASIELLAFAVNGH